MNRPRPHISIELWEKILQDPETTTPEVVRVFQALYARPDRRAAASDLGTDLGLPFSGDRRSLSTPTINIVRVFGINLGKNYELKASKPRRNEWYWILPFYSGPRPPEGGWSQDRPPIEEDTYEKRLILTSSGKHRSQEFFIWILRPELAEAMERLGLVGAEEEARRAAPHRNPQIPADLWMNILEDSEITTPEILRLFQALHAQPRHRAPAGRLAPLLGVSPAQDLNGALRAFGGKLGDAPYGLVFRGADGRRRYSLLPFHVGSAPPEGGWGPEGEPTTWLKDEQGRDIWTLRPELVKALECLELVGEAAEPEAAPEPVDLSEEQPSQREGERRERLATRYERKPRNRAACVAHYGARCFVCGFTFADHYGEFGAEYIQVHHRTPLAALAEAQRSNYTPDPIKDLVPLCANCHAMIHRPHMLQPRSPEEMRRLWRERHKLS